MRNKHVWGWYCYSFAAEVFSACALAIFIPIALEKVARDIGYLSPDWTVPCSSLDTREDGNGPGSGGAGGGGVEVEEVICRARILGVRVDSASFSMYTKSIAVALQALCIIAVGPLADSSFWRKRLLISFALLGALSGILFLPLPSGGSTTPILAALLTITGNVGYAVGTVCSNAVLPELAQEVHAGIAGDEDGGLGGAGAGAVGGRGSEGEDEPLLDDRGEAHMLARGGTAAGTTAGTGTGTTAVTGVPSAVIRAADMVLHGAAGAHPQTEELPPPTAPVQPDLIAPPPPLPPPIDSHTRHPTAGSPAAEDWSYTTSRLSSTCTALGFFSGVSVLALLLVPVTLMGGSTFSLRLAVGLSGVWWIVFLIPAAYGLPGVQDTGKGRTGRKAEERPALGDGWRRVGRMIRPDEVRRLSNLFTFLLTWIFLSDGFHTTTYIAILYASSQLHMSATKVGIIGILVQLTAVFSSVATPKWQRRMKWTNQQLLLRVAVAGGVLPMYACLGLVLPFGGLRSEGEMYVAAAWFGMLYGPFNSYSRAVYAELIPPGHESSFFSLFALTDKSASFIGPFIVGVIADTTGNIRLGFLCLLVMLAIPVPILMRVDMEAGKGEAREWQRRGRGA